MNISELINNIRSRDDCIVYKPSGVPLLNFETQLPNDMVEFYKFCGGIVFYPSSKYSFEIVRPENVILANPIIVGDLCPEDISSQWYIIAKDSDNNFITIDLSTERLGRCYDSFWDRHGVVGECMIIATSFSELVLRLYRNNGESIFWLEDDFEYLGDAYDNM